MRLPWLILPPLAFLLLTATIAAAPAPANPARVALEELKKKLPDVLAAFQKKITEEKVVWKVNVCRRIGPTEAKITLTDASNPDFASIITLSLRYYDGTWTTTHCEADFCGKLVVLKAYRLDLMLAIDEAAGK